MSIDERIDNIVKRINGVYEEGGNANYSICESDKRLIIEELLQMKERKVRVLSFPRIIIDTWDYANPLGEELLELKDAYLRIVN